MRMLKQAMGVLGALVVVIAIAALTMPKAAHGIVAAMVQVVNTSDKPVPTSDAGAALEPFEFEAYGGNSSVSFTTPSTTADGRAVQRLVIEEVTVVCARRSSPAALVQVSSFPGSPFSGAGANVGSAAFEGVHLFPFPNNPASAPQVLAQQTRIYVDPGVTVSMNAFELDASGECSYTASGHFIVQ